MLKIEVDRHRACKIHATGEIAEIASEFTMAAVTFYGRSRKTNADAAELFRALLTAALTDPRFWEIEPPRGDYEHTVIAALPDGADRAGI